MRPRKHAIDPDEILRRIHAQNVANHAADVAAVRRLERTPLNKRVFDHHYLVNEANGLLEDSSAGWIRYDIDLFTGDPDATDSVKVIHRNAVRALESHGFVQLRGLKATHVRLTAAGRIRIGLKP